ncbi:MAG: ACP S-malonyltransferase [Candidatus Omnitrophica bacterium]|jgi:[acyl-carrier-protein] S-malonyltransferase|nr:ACP S-malonyltransferase [Candidatus Omnitrophota bacterium]
MEKVAFLFAGQGSQYAGMGKDLYENFPEARQVFDKACEVLGIDLKKLAFEGPDQVLKPTNISQPAIVTMTIAAYEAFKKIHGVVPVFCAGLSLGEYSALIASGSISFSEGISLIKKRGEIMEEAAKKHPGKMAAVIDLASDKLADICKNTGAQIANLNCPGQTVITGTADAVAKASAAAQEAGAKRVIQLEVSGGFHSSLMKEASLELEAVLNTINIKDAQIPVISNYTAQPQTDAKAIRADLVSQIYSSVRWEESMRCILAQGVTRFVEFGPGKVLKGLMRRIDPSAQVYSIEKKDDIINFAQTEAKA